MRFSPGQTIVRRYIHHDGRVGWAISARVVSDDDRGLVTWVNRGSATAQRFTIDGEPTRYLDIDDKFNQPTIHLAKQWHSAGVLMYSPPGAAHSVWWFFDQPGDFKGWYVNLETPGRRWEGGRDCMDQALDVWIEPDRTWNWKDEDEFADYANRPGYWDDEQAAEIRAEGENLIKLAEAGEFPFDGTWCDFTPDPSWEPTRLPWWWDQTPDQTGYLRPTIDRSPSALACEAST